MASHGLPCPAAGVRYLLLAESALLHFRHSRDS